MSSFQFSCPACQRLLQVEANQKGTQVICPLCRAQVTVPHEEPVKVAQPVSKPEIPTATLSGQPNQASSYGCQQTVCYGAIPQANEPFAIVSFVCSLLSPFVCVASIVGIVFGHIAMSRIRESGGRLGGKGLATAGLVIGYVSIALTLIIAILWFGIYAFMMTTFFRVIEHEQMKQMEAKEPPYTVTSPADPCVTPSFTGNAEEHRVSPETIPPPPYAHPYYSDPNNYTPDDAPDDAPVPESKAEPAPNTIYQ